MKEEPRSVVVVRLGSVLFGGVLTFALVVVVLVRGRRRQILALLRGQARRVADEGGDGRDLLVLVGPAEARHARVPDALLDHREQLGVVIVPPGPGGAHWRRGQSLC